LDSAAINAVMQASRRLPL